jgi:hypothetical protein
MQEEFRDVEGYEGLYQVSNLGNVKSLIYGKERILKLSFDGSGYLKIDLYKNKIQKTIHIHQLVAMAFLNHTPCGMKLVVNHKDFNKLNNNVENLEIVTSRENTNKKHFKSSSKYTGVNWHKNRNKWQSQILINGKIIYLGLFKTELEASNAYELKLKTL